MSDHQRPLDLSAAVPVGAIWGLAFHQLGASSGWVTAGAVACAAASSTSLWVIWVVASGRVAARTVSKAARSVAFAGATLIALGGSFGLPLLVIVALPLASVSIAAINVTTRLHPRPSSGRGAVVSCALAVVAGALLFGLASALPRFIAMLIAVTTLLALRGCRAPRRARRPSP